MNLTAVDGNYNFGFIDSSEHCGPVTYTRVADKNALPWGWRATGYAIGDAPVKPTFMPAILDTGATLLSLYDEIAEDYWSHVQGAKYSRSDGGYIFPCFTTPPDFFLSINNSTTITIPGYFMNFRPAMAADHCFGEIQNGTASGAWNVFGDVAIKAALVVFDAGNGRVGWAPKLLSPKAPDVGEQHVGRAYKEPGPRKECYLLRRTQAPNPYY